MESNTRDMKFMLKLLRPKEVAIAVTPATEDHLPTPQKAMMTEAKEVKEETEVREETMALEIVMVETNVVVAVPAIAVMTQSVVAATMILVTAKIVVHLILKRNLTPQNRQETISGMNLPISI